MNPTVKATLKWTGITLGTLFVVLVLVLSFMDWNLLKHPIERVASAKSGRTIKIGGNLNVKIWSWAPTVTLNELVVGNPPWEASRPMLTVERLQVQLKLLPLLRGDVILPRVEITRPDLYLHQDKQGRANWTFENQAPTNAPASKPTKLPVMRDFIIESGKLNLADDIRKLKLDGTIEAHEKPSNQEPKPFHIHGKGTLNDQPFELNVAGGPLVNMDPDHPYPFDLAIRAGDIQVASDGKVLKPFDLAGMDFEVTVSGKDLAEGFYLTQLALPNTPPFKLHAHIARNGMRIAVTDIAGTVGQSDLHGKLDVDATRKRPSLTGDLVSDQLRMADLAASVGGKEARAGKDGDTLDSKTAKKEGTKEAARDEKHPEKAAPADPNARLFPDAHLQVDRVRAMDADVRFRAKSIQAGTVPFKQVALHVKMDDGVLSLDPFAFEMPQGHVTGNARIDARKQVPNVRIDVRVKDIELNQVKGKAPGAAPPFGGVMEARAVVDGKGDSVHQVMSNGNGTFTVIMPNGEVRSAFAELTGINVSKGLGLLLKGSNDRAEVRCGVAQFGIRDGVMTAQNVTFDTQNVVITGKGDIQLGSEKLDLSIRGEPKHIRFTRIRSAVEVRGTLMKPSVGLNAGDTIKQGAIAAALGTVLTPIAAVLAFVDPGLAKDQNCAQLVANAQSNAQSKGAPAPKSDVTPVKGVAPTRKQAEAKADSDSKLR
jgi:AsmA family protein